MSICTVTSPNQGRETVSSMQSYMPVIDSTRLRALASREASPPKTVFKLSRSLFREMNCFIALLTASMLESVSTSAFMVLTALPCAASSLSIDASSRPISKSTLSNKVWRVFHNLSASVSPPGDALRQDSSRSAAKVIREVQQLREADAHTKKR